MQRVKKWGLLVTVGCCLGAQTFEDPVMKARLHRAEAQGIEEADLPPVPRGVMEPPPLPPPEIHTKDSPHAKVAKAPRRRGARLRAGKQAPAVAAAPSPTPRAHVAKPARPAGKVARRPGKRVKG